MPVPVVTAFVVVIVLYVSRVRADVQITLLSRACGVITTSSNIHVGNMNKISIIFKAPLRLGPS